MQFGLRTSVALAPASVGSDGTGPAVASTGAAHAPGSSTTTAAATDASQQVGTQLLGVSNAFAPLRPLIPIGVHSHAAVPQRPSVGGGSSATTAGGVVLSSSGAAAGSSSAPAVALAAAALGQYSLSANPDGDALSAARVGAHAANNVVPWSSAASAVVGVDVALRKPLVASVGVDGTLRVWNYEERTCILTKGFAQAPLSVGESVAGQRRAPRVARAKARKVLLSPHHCRFPPPPLPHCPSFIREALHPSGYAVALGCPDRVRLYTLLLDDVTPVRGFALKGCTLLRFSNGGHLFAAGEWLLQRGWGAAEPPVGRPTRPSRARPSFARAAAPPGRAVNGPVINVFDTYGGGFFAALRGHSGKVRCPGGARPPAFTLARWSRPPPVCCPSSTQVTSMAWSPNDATLLSCGHDGAVYEWDLR